MKFINNIKNVYDIRFVAETKNFRDRLSNC